MKTFVLNQHTMAAVLASLHSDAQLGMLWQAMYAYQCGKQYEITDEATAIVFEFLKADILTREEEKAEVNKSRSDKMKAYHGRKKEETAAEKEPQSEPDTPSASATADEEKGGRRDETYEKSEPAIETPPPAPIPPVTVTATATAKPAAAHVYFKKPTLAEVLAYVAEKGYEWRAEDFFDFYESNGWKVGRNSMKDWKAACRNWERGHKERRYTPSNNNGQRTIQQPVCSDGGFAERQRAFAAMQAAIRAGIDDDETI